MGPWEVQLPLISIVVEYPGSIILMGGYNDGRVFASITGLEMYVTLLRIATDKHSQMGSMNHERLVFVTELYEKEFLFGRKRELYSL